MRASDEPSSTTYELFDISTGFDSWALAKQEYIDNMHGIDSLLFDDADDLKVAKISAIEISQGPVILRPCGTVIKTFYGGNNKRTATVGILSCGPYEKAGSGMMSQFVDVGRSGRVCDRE